MTSAQPRLQRLATIVAFTCMMVFTFGYLWRAIRGQSHPVIATWIMFCVATTMSFETYRRSSRREAQRARRPAKSLLRIAADNISNSMDTLICWIILLALLLFGHELRPGFNTFDVGCLAAAGLIILFWKVVEDQDKTANLALQTLMSVAYLPTFYQLWFAKTNTEPFDIWLVALVGCTAALYRSAFVPERETLAIVYAARSSSYSSHL